MNKRLTKQADQIVQQIVRDITHSPGGYQYWQQLPQQWHYSASVMQKRWNGWLRKLLLPPAVQMAAVQACLSAEGIPDNKGRALYHWLIDTVYDGNEQLLYHDWLQVQQVSKPTNNSSNNQ